MFGGHFPFGQVTGERLWLPAFFVLDQLQPDRMKLELAGLVTADQIADTFAVIGEVSASICALIHLSCFSVTVMVLRVVPIFAPIARMKHSYH